MAEGVFIRNRGDAEDEKAVDSLGDGIPVGVAAIPFPDTHPVHAERNHFRLGIEILHLDGYALASVVAQSGTAGCRLWHRPELYP